MAGLYVYSMMARHFLLMAYVHVISNKGSGLSIMVAGKSFLLCIYVDTIVRVNICMAGMFNIDGGYISFFIVFIRRPYPLTINSKHMATRQNKRKST